MKYYGTKNNKDYGFYEENFENAVAITEVQWGELLEQQNAGKIIILYNNEVIAADENEYVFTDGTWNKLSATEAEEKRLQIKKTSRTSEIEILLDQLDRKRIRAIAEPSLKDEETTWLEYYNSEIQKLRDERASL